MDFFPEVNGEEVCAERWHIEPLPHPRFHVRCGHCADGDSRRGTILLRLWSYDSKPQGFGTVGRMYRCNVSFKCLRCSNVWECGVVVPNEHWHRRAQQKRYWHWREGRAMIRAHYDGEDGHAS